MGLFQKDTFLARLAYHGGNCERDVSVFETLDSTSSELRRRFAKGAAPTWAGTVAVAHLQTGGRGRLGRTWYSPSEGNLCLSLAAAVNGPVDETVPLVPLAAGLAAHRAVTEAGAAPLLKWPNDVLLGDKKAAGILCEAVALTKTAALMIVGIGVNIVNVPFPADIANTAVALDTACETPVEISALAARFVHELEVLLERIEKGARSELVDAWRGAAEPFGRRVKIGELTGKTIDLAPDGRLIVENDAKEVVLVAGGIVESLDLF